MPDTPTPIHIGFRGLMVMCISPQRPDFGEIGLIGVAPGHNLSFKVNRTVSGNKVEIASFGEGNFPPIIDLRVPDYPGRGIKFAAAPPGFNRLTNEGSIRDHRWIIDMESEFYRDRLSVNPSGFRSFIRMNDGEFYTVCKTEHRARKVQHGTSVPFGKVVAIVKAKIALPAGIGASLLFAGGQVDFGPGEDLRYDIEVDRGCPMDMSDEQDHFMLYYNAIGHTIPEGDRITVEPETSGEHEGVECSPHPEDIRLELAAALDVRCTKVRLSQTERLTPVDEE